MIDRWISMHLSEQIYVSPRSRRRYIDEYKMELVAQHLRPHVLITYIVLINRLNANLLRHWVKDLPDLISYSVLPPRIWIKFTKWHNKFLEVF